MPRIIHPPAGTLNLAQPVFGVPALVEGEFVAPYLRTISPNRPHPHPPGHRRKIQRNYPDVRSHEFSLHLRKSPDPGFAGIKGPLQVDG